MKITENVEISGLTTMRLGGKTRYLIDVEQLSDIKNAFDFVEEKNLPFFILGDGANTIGKDEGFPGAIIRNKMKGIEVVLETTDEVAIRAFGGENWDDLIQFACERAYSGIECMSKIPGTVGAAPVQNIGAYGQDISQVIESVEAYDTKEKELVVIGREEMQMGYRRTIFNHGDTAGRYFIVSVTLLLENEEFLQPPFYAGLQKYIDEHGETDFSPMNIRRMVSEIRAAKLPDPEKEASAGSFFKNVYLSDENAELARKNGLKVWDKEDGRYMINAGYLIESAGLKGKTLHGFKVSDKAALILINENAESYADLDAARKEIRDAVREKFGYELEQEPVELA